MIEAPESVFPHNVVDLVAIPLNAIDSDITCYKRPLRNSDPRQSIGIHSQLWSPDQSSLEILGADSPAPQLPTLQTYTYGIQSFVKDSDEARGLAIHSTLSTHVRGVLYMHVPLRVALGQLKVEYENGQVEALKRWGVRTARYFSGEIDSINLYLSTLEFWVETETRGA
jgi:hypothetical protein